jgi:hypothetical protein
VIEPDTKDWTWVLDRACPDCGFDARSCVGTEVAALVRANAQAWQGLCERDAIKPGREIDSKWSTLEYACHVRDVYRRYDQRIGLMLAEADPMFPNWDQDVSAIEDRYDEQDPHMVVDELVVAADELADRLEHLAEDEWARPGRRSDGASFTVDTIARYMVHDPIITSGT